MENKLNKARAIEEANTVIRQWLDNEELLEGTGTKTEKTEIKKTETEKCEEYLSLMLKNKQVQLKPTEINGEVFYNMFVDGIKITYQFDSKLISKDSITKYLNIITNIVYMQVFNKFHSKFHEDWSYIDEKEEYNDQIIYNQTLSLIIQYMDVDTIIVNTKLKPLFETFYWYNKDVDINCLQVDNKAIIIKYITSDENENIIYGYNSKDLDKPQSILRMSDIELINELVGVQANMFTPFKHIEIRNIDDGVFGIVNKLVRTENASKIELFLDPQAELEYIAEVMKLNYGFSGVRHINFEKPKHRYSYHAKFLADMVNNSNPSIVIEEPTNKKEDITPLIEA